jgi:hypothetical protein
MNVGEVIQALSKLDPDLPVVIDQEDLQLFGEYLEVMSVRFSDDEIFRDDDRFSLDGMRPFDRCEWRFNRDKKADPAVIVGCRLSAFYD